MAAAAQPQKLVTNFFPLSLRPRLHTANVNRTNYITSSKINSVRSSIPPLKSNIMRHHVPILFGKGFWKLLLLGDGLSFDSYLPCPCPDLSQQIAKLRLIGAHWRMIKHLLTLPMFKLQQHPHTLTALVVTLWRYPTTPSPRLVRTHSA